MACVVLRGSIQLPGTVNDVMQILTPRDTSEARKTLHQLYGNCFLDTQCLAQVASDLKVEWSAFRHPNSGLDGVDYCFIQASGFETKVYATPEPTASRRSSSSSTQSTVERTIGYVVQHSIERPEVPPLETMYRLGRGAFRRTGIVVEPTARSNMVQVTGVFQVDGGTMPYRHSRGQSVVASQALVMSESVMKQRLMTLLTNISPILERKRLSRMQFVEKWQCIACTECCFR